MTENGPTTFVFVHGSWHSGESWERVARPLRAAGHTVFAPDLTGHGRHAAAMTPKVGLSTHVDDIVRLIRDEELRDVVLVGHSYGGAVITCAAEELPERIARLIYIDAVVPENGESTVDVMPEVFTPFIEAALVSAAPWLMPPPQQSPAGLFGITDPSDIEWVRSTLTPQSVLSWMERARLDNRRATAIPRSHIHCALHPRADARRPVPPIQPNGTPADVWEIQSGHDCMVIAPSELVELLLTIATDNRSIMENPR
ncbi:alpha/beta hydrolase [Microbacterium rhizomatis]|uniref:Alpha/beta hydrolase n=2 Tax=Microbacterium rhizomatis TaxID=1631477 RepID=A0A5J5IZA3_9MICO|nr:alpha/beta hydrolase [Microbacterium rhizomatis]KAA9107722.1 alpha/beta hydrolase [Microbacterium rhizomatis]